jgi:uncharacterized protein YkwD
MAREQMTKRVFMGTIVPMNTRHFQNFLYSLCILLLAVPLSSNPARSEPPPFANPNAGLEETEAYLHQSINRIRGQHHLPALKESPTLRQIAREHSHFMARNGYLGHGNGDGRDFRSRIEQAKLKGWRMVGENVGRSFGYRNNAAVIVSGWLESEPHRNNILSNNFDMTGIGTALAEDGTLYATQVFLGSADRTPETTQ